MRHVWIAAMLSIACNEAEPAPAPAAAPQAAPEAAAAKLAVAITYCVP